MGVPITMTLKATTGMTLTPGKISRDGGTPAWIGALPLHRPRLSAGLGALSDTI